MLNPTYKIHLIFFGLPSVFHYCWLINFSQVPSAVNPNECRESAAPRSETLARWGVPAGKRVLGFLGRISHEKNPGYYVEVLNKMPHEWIGMEKHKLIRTKNKNGKDTFFFFFLFPFSSCHFILFHFILFFFLFCFFLSLSFPSFGGLNNVIEQCIVSHFLSNNDITRYNGRTTIFRRRTATSGWSHNIHWVPRCVWFSCCSGCYSSSKREGGTLLFFLYSLLIRVCF